MTERNDGGPAFPTPRNEFGQNSPSMSLREWYRGQALPLAHADYLAGIPEYTLKALFGGRGGLTRYEIIAAIADLYADDMLAIRARKP